MQSVFPKQTEIVFISFHFSLYIPVSTFHPGHSAQSQSLSSQHCLQHTTTGSGPNTQQVRATPLTLHPANECPVLTVTVSTKEGASCGQARFAGAFWGAGKGPVVDLLSGFMSVCFTTNLLTCIWRLYVLFCTYISLFKNKRVHLEGIIDVK